jgi:DNA-binding transcriptional MerR regulator
VAKSKEAFRTISEVAADLGVPQHVLRFWESKFSQIKPLKRAGGRRYYRPEDIDLLKGIQRLLHTEGYTIKGVQKIFREHGPKAIQRGLIGGDKSVATKAIGRAAIAPEAKPSESAEEAAMPPPALAPAHRRVLASLRNDLSEIRRLLKSTQ